MTAKIIRLAICYETLTASRDCADWLTPHAERATFEIPDESGRHVFDLTCGRDFADVARAMHVLGAEGRCRIRQGLFKGSAALLERPTGAWPPHR